MIIGYQWNLWPIPYLKKYKISKTYETISIKKYEKTEQIKLRNSMILALFDNISLHS